MANLRLVTIDAPDSTTIEARFTDDLDSLINTSNVSITSNIPGVPDPSVLRVVVSDDSLAITTQPMTPNAIYFVEFKGSSTVDFKSRDGASFLLEDGRTNIPMLLGPEDPADPIRDFLINFLKDGVFNLQKRTLVRDIINGQSTSLSRGLYDIRQTKNDNYLTKLIVDERKTRGTGPYDRLNEEGAYEITRVGRSETAVTLSTSFSYSLFPPGIITLLQKDVAGERLSAGSGLSTFDGLILTVAQEPVIRLNSVVFSYADGSSAEYDVSTYGYQVKDPRYDRDHASTLLTLEDNQFKLSDLILESGIVLPVAGDTVIIGYSYKSLGRIIDEESVAVTQVLDAVREVTPAIMTVFDLDYAPVVTVADEIASVGGVEFLDPESNPPFSAAHPAFTNEIPFRYEGLPKAPGEYSVDYENGRVFSYGAVTNDGTGNYPPIANYKYRKTFASRLDYTYDPTTSDLAANPLRDLIDQQAKISFDYEETFVPGEDFIAQVHNEVLNERVENRINATNSVSVSNAPITDVFRVYNETSGEVYNVVRWNNHSIFFTYSTPPNILAADRERASFANVLNETLLVDDEFVNGSGIRVFKITLSNNRIMSSTEDVVGASYNSSASFSRADLFFIELYYDSQILSVTANTDRLGVGDFQIDYQNGILYVGVLAAQGLDLGTINYKKPVISPVYPHLVSVSDLYHSISTIQDINKKIDYVSFDEGEIFPSSFDRADERFLGGDTSLPYIVSSNTITVTDDIKQVRSIYDVYDLNNSDNPINFALGATSLAHVITLDVDGIPQQTLSTVGAGLVVAVPFVSAGVEIATVTSVARLSDGVELYDAGGSFSGYDITLSGAGGPVPGDVVSVTYSLRLNGAATPVVDYNRGDYFIDYTYLADEILVSYEYGDNVVDFRESSALEEGDEYYVSYRVGALRNSLLKNFGSLVDVPVMRNFDTTFARERYRDALMAALQSFTKGPTLPALTLLVSKITHIDPEIIEGAFTGWSLGISHLYPDAIDYTGDIQLLAAKFDNGALVANPDESISFPVSSNLRLEEGTLETWVIPEWDGLDNDATLTFELRKDGYVLPASEVYIGASSFHPIYDDNNRFTVNRLDIPSPIGLPSAVFTKTGVFIYYDEHSKRWKVLAKDFVGTRAYDSHGNIISGVVYTGTILSSGEVYDVKFIPGLGELSDVLRSGMEKIVFEFHLDGYDVLSPDGYDSQHDGYQPGYSFDGIDFMADDEHYIFDFGETDSTNRFSIFKDGRGYLNFRIFDRGDSVTGRKNQYKVSADISSWRSGEKHHVATSWKINTSDRQDEMHLFIDGFEVTNIMRYGGRPISSSTDRFRTVKPELVAGLVPLPAVTSNDLHTTAGSATVVSDSVDFTAAGIVPGHTIHILESGFTTYTILSVINNILELDTAMPTTLEDARFSVNEYSVVVSSEIDLFTNIAVSIISGGVETEIPGLRAEIPGYSISKDLFNQNVLTLLGDAKTGDQIAIRTFGLNHRRCRERQFVWGNTSNVIKTQLPPPISLDEAYIYPVLLPLLPIGPGNSIIVAGRFIAAGISPTQPSSDTEGRTLAVRMTGGNIDFTSAPTVTIFGTTQSGAPSETLTFASPSTQNTTEKFMTITSVTADVRPYVLTRNSAGIEIKEAFPITFSEGNIIFPVLRFSYKTQTGLTLEGDGSAVVTDLNGYFIDSNIGQIMIINTPAPVAGSYTITSRIGTTSVTLHPPPAAPFINGTYDIFNVTLGRSGFQNGFFTLEQAGATNTPFPLKQGWYEFDYSAHLEMPMDPVSGISAYIGSDRNTSKQAKAIIDEFRILSTQLTDVRVGEHIEEHEDSVTTDWLALRPFTADSDTLMLIHFDSLPFENDSDFWVSFDKEYLQSGSSINGRFLQSVVVTNRPLIIDNKGRLSVRSEGSIEFWVSPRYDTYNDPNLRFYFDATGSIIEEVTSITNGTVKISASAADIISVRLQTDTTNTGIEYFAGGSLLDDFKTLRLGKILPSQQTPVKVDYIPSGLSGNRISIYKDEEGFITFNVRAQEVDYQVRQPVFWSRDSWHRVRATYKFNRPDNLDEVRLFVDGEERGTILFGSGLLFGEGIIFGQGFAGVDNSILISDINFTDPINEFYIGSDYLGVHTAQARLDNFRLSDISRDPLLVAGQAKDINYSSNLATVYPVIEDAFTTYLVDFNQVKFKTTDLALLKDEKFGIFNFTIQVIDSFEIVSSSAKIQQVLENLIYALKPAQSKVTINYVR